MIAVESVALTAFGATAAVFSSNTLPVITPVLINSAPPIRLGLFPLVFITEFLINLELAMFVIAVVV